MEVNLVRLREAAGLTQTDLAFISGISQPNISAYDSGRRKPLPETLERLLQALRPRPSVALAPHRDEVIELARRRGIGNVRSSDLRSAVKTPRTQTLTCL